MAEGRALAVRVAVGGGGGGVFGSGTGDSVGDILVGHGGEVCLAGQEVGALAASMACVGFEAIAAANGGEFLGRKGGE